MRFLVRLVAGQAVSVATLAAAAMVWPRTAAQVETGLRTFAVWTVALALGFLAVIGVLVVKSQMAPPYQDRQRKEHL